MSETRIMIQVHSASILNDDQFIMLSDSYMRRWKLQSNQTITLRFGSFRTSVKVISMARSEGLRMNDGLAKKLGIPHGTQMKLQFKTSSQTLAMGPLIGVLVSRVNPGAQDKLFGAITSYCKEVTDACKAQGAFVFFFTPSEISSHHQSLSGWRYAGGKWTKTVLPIPDVVHNRLTSRKLENLPSVQQFMKEVKSRYNSNIFNEKYLDKSEVFQALRNETSLKRYLPESYTIKNYQMLKSMVSKHSTVFLKPIYGSLGKGIIRISKQNNSYVCHFTNVNGSTKQTFNSITAVFNTISNKIKAQRYQIQQGLNLIEIGNRPVDFRALVQKDKTGKWGVTSIVARIAGSHHFVSNLARGGTLSTVKGALSKSNLSAQQRLLAQSTLRKAAVDIADGIDAQIQRHFGELGVDLAVDTRGKVWLLEVNSKPSKNDGTPLDNGGIRPSVKKMVQYAKYLAGF